MHDSAPSESYSASIIRFVSRSCNPTAYSWPLLTTAQMTKDADEKSLQIERELTLCLETVSYPRIVRLGLGLRKKPVQILPAT